MVKYEMAMLGYSLINYHKISEKIAYKKVNLRGDIKVNK